MDFPWGTHVGDKGGRGRLNPRKTNSQTLHSEHLRTANTEIEATAFLLYLKAAICPIRPQIGGSIPPKQLLTAASQHSAQLTEQLAVKLIDPGQTGSSEHWGSVGAVNNNNNFIINIIFGCLNQKLVHIGPFKGLSAEQPMPSLEAQRSGGVMVLFTICDCDQLRQMQHSTKLSLT